MISLNNSNCIGCGGCASVCPNQCITMKPDREGFLFPTVQMDLCVNCHLCEKVCIINNELAQRSIINSYAGYSKDDLQRGNSSSGGLFYELAKHILDLNGVVFGAAFDESWQVRHIMCSDLNDLHKLQTSKYIQSDTTGVFQQVKKVLDAGIMVLFSGTPCQCNALSLYLGNDYTNLLLVDFICHGVPSPLVWEKYLFHNCLDLIVEICFRDKATGWSDYSVFVKTENQETREPYYNNEYMQLFLNDYSLRLSCYSCNSKFPYKTADITMGDLWGASSIAPEMDDNKGLSLIVVNSIKGNSIFDAIHDKVLYKKIDYNMAFSSNPSAIQSVDMPKDRKRFFKDIQKDNIDFEKLVKKYCKKPSIPARAINKAKRIVKRYI